FCSSPFPTTRRRNFDMFKQSFLWTATAKSIFTWIRAKVVNAFFVLSIVHACGFFAPVALIFTPSRYSKSLRFIAIKKRVVSFAAECRANSSTRHREKRCDFSLREMWSEFINATHLIFGQPFSHRESLFIM